MTPTELDTCLRTLTEHEKMYKMGWQNPETKTSMDTATLSDTAFSVVRLDERFLPLSGRKHSRFASYPAHIHPWVELNYMYSGSCTQKVNGKSITISEGQTILLGQNTTHELPVLQENDILLNIFIRKEYLNYQFFNRFSHNQNIVSQFLLDAVTDGISLNNYLFFQSEHSRRLPLLIREFFCEQFDPSPYSDDIMTNLFALILTELIQIYYSDAAAQRDITKNTNILSILNYIENNFATVTLNDTARKFNLNPDYLSRILRKKTGNSFQSLVNQQRMVTAGQLLAQTNLSVVDIANRVGYDNVTFFYKKFHEYYHCSPKEYRNTTSGF